MADLNLTLLRERFSIRERGGSASKGPLIAVSNRMMVPLIDQNGKEVENFIVRTQNMHTCVRMAGKIISTFQRIGPILNRPDPFAWDAAWESIIEDHEHQFNPNRWVCVYAKGRPVFSTHAHHIFLDLVEKCDHDNPDSYDEAVKLAEISFKKMGKNVKIDHESNVALVVTLKKTEARCGVILRGATKTATFSYTSFVRDKETTINPALCLSAASAFLEGIQLSYMVGSINEKVALGLVEQYSDEWRKADSGHRRLGQLNAEIRNFENVLDVRYRPEKPDFNAIIEETAKNIRSSISARIDAEAEKVT